MYLMYFYIWWYSVSYTYVTSIGFEWITACLGAVERHQASVYDMCRSLFVKLNYQYFMTQFVSKCTVSVTGLCVQVLTTGATFSTYSC